MILKKIELVKSHNENTIYKCGPVNYLVKKKGSISKDHVHSKTEVIFLIEGEIKLITDKETKLIAPIKFEIPPNVHHKVIAITNTRMIYLYQ